MSKLFSALVVFCLLSQAAHATICPDPDKSSLKWGEIPSPWTANPFSANQPQGDESTKFVRANIMIAGIGRGVICTYQNSLGEYSIWWQTLVKIPARTDYQWINVPSGFMCTESLITCQFTAV